MTPFESYLSFLHDDFELTQVRNLMQNQLTSPVIRCIVYPVEGPVELC